MICSTNAGARLARLSCVRALVTTQFLSLNKRLMSAVGRGVVVTTCRGRFRAANRIVTCPTFLHHTAIWPVHRTTPCQIAARARPRGARQNKRASAPFGQSTSLRLGKKRGVILGGEIAKKTARAFHHDGAGGGIGLADQRNITSGMFLLDTGAYPFGSGAGLAGARARQASSNLSSFLQAAIGRADAKIPNARKAQRFLHHSVPRNLRRIFLLRQPGQFLFNIADEGVARLRVTFSFSPNC